MRDYHDKVLLPLAGPNYRSKDHAHKGWLSLTDGFLCPTEVCAKEVPVGASGVYFLLNGQRVAYVGKSVNVSGRIGTHYAKPPARFNRAVYLPVEPGELDACERAFIRFFKPIGNTNLAGNWARDDSPEGDRGFLLRLLNEKWRDKTWAA